MWQLKTNYRYYTYKQLKSPQLWKQCLWWIGKLGVFSFSDRATFVGLGSGLKYFILSSRNHRYTVLVEYQNNPYWFCWIRKLLASVGGKKQQNTYCASLLCTTVFPPHPLFPCNVAQFLMLVTHFYGYAEGMASRMCVPVHHLFFISPHESQPHQKNEEKQ